jgi:hypothetical protein
MAYKESKRREARLLRHADWSLRRIAGELDVALSTVSVWVRDIPRHPVPSLTPDPPDPWEEQPPVAPPDLEAGSRYCSRCERNLSVTAFNRHGGGRQWWCRECFRAYFRERGELHRQQVARTKPARIRRLRRYVCEYLRRHPCSQCSESDISVLDFHHLGDKTAEIARMVSSGLGVERVAEEISRCKVLCANCHRRVTAASIGWWRLDPSVLDGRNLDPTRRRNLRYVWTLLEKGSCCDCGETDPVVLEFDHIGEKRKSVCDLARYGCSILTLQAEIAKCEIRCVSCHRRRHRGGQPSLRIAS